MENMFLLWANFGKMFRAMQCARRAAAAAAPACSALRLSTPAFFAPAAAVPRGAALRHFSAAPSAYLELNEGQQKLSAVTAAHPKVLAYFTAAWCGPCKAIAPHFTKLAQDTAAVKFVKVDVDDNGVTAEEVRRFSLRSFLRSY